MSFRELLKKLDQDNLETMYDPFPLGEENLPDIFLTATPQMMKDF